MLRPVLSTPEIKMADVIGCKDKFDIQENRDIEGANPHKTIV